MKERAPAVIAIACLLFLRLGTGELFGETIRVSDAEDASSVEFFREKFDCVRWVEKKSPDSKCLECHAGILKDEQIKAEGVQGSSTGVMRIHAQHMRSVRVNFTCLTCHKAVDPYQASATGLRT